MDEVRIYKACYEYAAVKHKDQLRKDNITPYITHPESVSNIVKKYAKDDEALLEMMVAALFHDIIEDTPATIDELRVDLLRIYCPDAEEDIAEYIKSLRTKHPLKLKGGNCYSFALVEDVVGYVSDLTNTITRETYPDLNRQQRQKKARNEFVRNAGVGSRIVKLADIIDNMSTIEKLEPDFATIYLCEEIQLVKALKMDHPIYDKAKQTLIEALEKIL